jgi:purine nucleosidase
MGSFSPDLDQWEPDRGDAVDFILDSCRRRGKELTVIGLGPFCNLAEALRRDPEALNLAGRVVIMGGAYFRQYADWNVMCDVPAAAVMFGGLSNLVCIGADVTHRLAADDFLMDALRGDTGNAAFRYIREQYRQWQADHPKNKLVLHDVLTVYYTLDPSICAMERIRVMLLTEGFAKGLTLNVDAYSKSWLNSAYTPGIVLPEVLAARDVDLEKFHSMIRHDILRCGG